MAALRVAGHDPVYQSTKEPFVETLREPADLVVIAGGDGTVSKVTAHLHERGLPIAVLPVGTANNISDTLGLQGSLHRLITTWESAPRLPFDVGITRGPWGKAAFVEGLGVGLLAHHMEWVERHETPSHDNAAQEISHDLHRLRECLAEVEARELAIDLDGQDLSGRYLMVEVMNTRHLGPNLRPAPNADPGDGLFDLVLLTEDQREAFDEYLLRSQHGPVPPPALPVYQGRHIQLQHGEGPVHVDGKLWPHESLYGLLDETATTDGTIEITVAPGALEFLGAT